MGWVKASIISGSAALAAAGCNGTTPPPLRPEAFIMRPGVQSGIITRQTDQNGTLVYGELHAPILPDEYSNPKPLSTDTPRPFVAQQIASTQNTVSPTSAPTSLPAGPTSQPDSAGTYQVVGAVVAVVNGKPIYADKILSSLDQQLAADARRMGPAEFRASASEKIVQRVQTVVQSQQYLAAANEFLSAESKGHADMGATMWRYQQVQASGGSSELAKEKALRETGTSLDELVQDRRDEILISIFLDEHVHPLIQVTPTDMRRYYEQHIADFTQTAEAKFRIIKISVVNRGGAEEAAAVVKKVMDKLHARVSFEDVAKLYNDDPSGGVVAGGGWVQKGSYVNEDVENAVWKLSPGEFTDPPIRVADQNAYYIAQLDAKKNGNVQPFEDTAVQAQIDQTLQGKQFAELQQSLTQKLMRQSVTTYIDGWDKTILDMAMQRYAAWTSAR